MVAELIKRAFKNNKRMNRNLDTYNQYLENQFGTRYPHLDIDGGFRSSIKKLITPLNPFAAQQVATPNRLAFMQFKGHRFYAPDPLPNPIKFSRFVPIHYDALNDTTFTPADDFLEGMESSGTTKVSKIIKVEPIPVCTRYLSFYKRCAMINGADKCRDEEKEFLEVCPNFALNDMRNGKLQQAKYRQVQLDEYKYAMEVSPYNKGRSMKNVDISKRWIDGTAERLRPDSMWADGRYADVSEDEIVETRKRLAARLAKEGYKPSTELRIPKPIDKVYEVFHVEKPLFESS